ncbi:hypothetical protein SpAn4DRAFT_1204 [Sporomusa ovata]|uniref:Uncharacterized protein n=1 Tax=Sporomusa ovata TaxID=2378 RepID=A0A0U1KSJ2_9FIRM|nr:hypothetical protein SpAn4DRAFT_1204 [Sporomusa ovata]
MLFNLRQKSQKHLLLFFSKNKKSDFFNKIDRKYKFFEPQRRRVRRGNVLDIHLPFALSVYYPENVLPEKRRKKIALI